MCEFCVYKGGKEPQISGQSHQESSNKEPFKNNRKARNAVIGLILTAVNKF